MSGAGKPKKETTPKRAYQDKSWDWLHEELKKWPDDSLNQIRLEAEARQVDATNSIAKSSRRLEVSTWILVGSSAVLLIVTVVLLGVTAHWW
jgi:hypothetical protein